MELQKMFSSMKKEYEQFYEEWYERGESITPYYARMGEHSYEHWLLVIDRGIHISDRSAAPSSMLALVDETGRIYGMVEIRHLLTETLKENGGHIGYGIRPTERGKGYGKEILRLALVEAKLLGIDEVQLDCNVSNIRSNAVVVANGGVFSHTKMYKGVAVNEYHISTSSVNE